MPSTLDSLSPRPYRRQLTRRKSRSSRLRWRALEMLEQRALLAGDVSGFVYVDTNGQGVPGALVTLTGTATGGAAYTQSMLTSNTGAFLFDDVPDGTYSLIESQPSALAQGSEAATASGATTGANVISNLVVAGANITGNVFHERALYPEYVSLSLFFSSAGLSPQNAFRSVIAAGEERAGNLALAAQIRAGASTVTPPDNTNVAPVGVANSYTIATGQTLTISALTGVLANDTDADGDTLTAALVSTTTNGTLALNANGSFTYTPTASFTGTDTFTYRANDGAINSAITTVTITVTATNQAPVATNDSYTATEDTPLNIAVGQGVLANDTDAESNALTAAVVTTTTNGTLTLNANGSFTYTPNANFAGTDTFTYKVNDGTVDSNTATVTITVTGVNDTPTAVVDTYQTNVDSPLTVSVEDGVLDNDTDPENTALTATLVTTTAHGTLTLNANGSFNYTPTAGYKGLDTFVYVATDGTNVSNAITVTIQVNNVPAAVGDAYNATEDTPLVINADSGVLDNDTDANGDALTAVVVQGPAHGTLTLNTDGSFTYTPAANYTGTDTFTYRASDGISNSAPATVTITIAPINDAPTAVNDSYNATQDTPLTISVPGVQQNDTDPDGDTLTASVVANPTNGTLNFNSDGSFVYTPATGFTGTDTFTYKVNDGTLDSATATVTITVTATPVAPVANNDSYTATEDTPLTIATAAGVLLNDTSGTLTAAVVTGPAHGTLTLNTDGSFTYTPAANYNGTDTFTYQANNGTLDSNIATVTITITAVNDAPTGVNDSYETTVGTPLVTNAAQGVLANDTDVEGSALTATVVANPAHGTVTLNSDGSFTYTPTAGYQGLDTFTYTANDGTADSATTTVTITINGAPVGTADSYTATEDTPLTVDAATGVLANDTDPDDDDLTAVIVTQAAHGTVTLNADGSFVYTPTANYSGADSFTYKATDGLSESAPVTVTITVTGVNDAPVANDDTYSTNEDVPLVVTTGGVLANDTDVDGSALTAIEVTQPAHGTLTLNPDGTFTYTPTAGYVGSDSFTYKVNDGSADSNVATVNITVSAVNDAPVAVDDSYTTSEDTALTVPLETGVLDNDTDADSTTLTAAVVTPPAHGNLTLNADGSFTYTPHANYNGADTFTYKVSDGTSESNIATVTLTITAVNDAPVALADSYSTGVDDVLTVPAATGVLANDTDVENSTLTATLVATTTHGQLTLSEDGSFTYTPTAGFRGTDTFTYFVNDGTADSATVTVTLLVNDPPVAAGDTYTTNADAPLTVPVASGLLDNDTDSSNDPLTAIVVVGPEHGELTLSTDGSFTYTPDAGYTGADTFTYKANDGLSDSNVATVTITVGTTNAPPVAVDDSYNATEDAVLTIDAASGVLDNDTDSDSATLTVEVVADPQHGTVVLSADGSFTYTPAANYSGTDTFTYQASDGTGLSNIATVTITIAAVNDAPVATNNTYSTSVDGTLTVAVVPGVLGNDSDLDGDSLQAVLVDDVQHGALTLNPDGTFTYTPTAGYVGQDTFTYTASDGTLQSNVATVTINVIAAPLAANDSYATPEDEALTITAPGVLINDTYADIENVTIIIVAPPAHGDLVMNGDGSFVYTPDANYFGLDNFTYKLSENGAESSVVTVAIDVTTVNDVPVAGDDEFTTLEDTDLSISVAAVLSNDTDVEGATLTPTVVTSPAHGTLTFNEDGTITYEPDANFNGTDSFTYTVSDGTNDSNLATIVINVTPVNDVPVALNEAYDTIVGVPRVVSAAEGVLANDTDADNQTLQAVLVQNVQHGTLELNPDGSFTYTPTAGFTGTDGFSYRATDGTTSSPTTAVTIIVNTPPVASNDSYAVTPDTALTVAAATGVLSNDTDANSNPLTAVLVTGPAHGTLTLNPDGSFVYTPTAGYTGTDSFTYRAQDAFDPSNEATVTLEIGEESFAGLVDQIFGGEEEWV